LSAGSTSRRALANHELYLAKIVLSAWRRDLDKQDIPARTLGQAFHNATREHLVAAYGWFLLSITRADAPTQGLPRTVEDLPPMPEGRVFPGEINEFRQLEGGGWLGQMLRRTDSEIPGPRQPGNLAFASTDVSGAEQAAGWVTQLEQLFDRMGDSLDEY